MARDRRQLSLDFSSRSAPIPHEETFEEAYAICFPFDPTSDEALYQEFCRLFPDP